MRRLNKNQILEFLNKDISGDKINPRILSLFLKQLSLLIDAGIGLDKSLKMIEDQNLDKKLTKALHKINKDLDNGLSVYDAFNNHKISFNPIIISFIKSGDQSGKLSDVLDELSVYMDEDSKNKSVIKQAMVYPILLLLVTIAIIIIITTFVLPTFEDVFSSSDHILPLSTRLLLSISSFFVNYGFLILVFLLIIIISILVLRKDDKFRLKLDEFIFKHLGFKKLRRLGFEYQFTSLLYILRAGDVDISTSLVIIKDSFDNTYQKQIIDKISSDVDHGISLRKSIENSNTFSPLLVSMIKIGEDSSQMIEALKKTSIYFSNEYIYKMKEISTMIEPIIVIIMSIFVGFVVFSVAIPIFDSVNAI